jgi:type IV pilus assembly protein PilM
MSKLPDHVGIDFGNYSVKAVELQNIKATPSLLAFGGQSIPAGVLNSEDKGNQKKLAEALKTLYKSAGFRNRKVVLAIPESAVFTRYIDLPGLKENELETAVYFKAKQYIPIPIEDVQMSYIVLGFDEAKNSYNILLVAAPRKTIDIYLNIASQAGLETLAIEAESIAIGRSMYKATGIKHMVVLDFGSKTTDMSIVYDGKMIFSQSVAIGSDSMTQALVNQFGFEYAQAEQYKRNYGVTPNILENKIHNTLKPILDAMLVEVQRGVEFYKTTTLRPAPKDFFLSGEGALLPGLPEFIQNSFNINARVADPWNNIQIPKKLEPFVVKNRPNFSVALGLALKEF